MKEFLLNIAGNLLADLIFLGITVLVSYFAIAQIKRFVDAARFARRMIKHGFMAFYCSRTEYYTERKESELSDYIKLTQRRFQYIGFYLSEANDAGRLDEALREIISRGAIVEIVILSPEIDSSTAIILEDILGISKGTLIARLRNALSYFFKFRDQLEQEQKNRFVIKTHAVPIYSSAMLIDFDEQEGRMLVDTKIPEAGRTHSFGMEFRPVSGDGLLSTRLARFFKSVSDRAVVPTG